MHWTTVPSEALGPQIHFFFLMHIAAHGSQQKVVIQIKAKGRGNNKSVLLLMMMIGVAVRGPNLRSCCLAYVI